MFHEIYPRLGTTGLTAMRSQYESRRNIIIASPFFLISQPTAGIHK